MNIIIERSVTGIDEKTFYNKYNNWNKRNSYR